MSRRRSSALPDRRVLVLNHFAVPWHAPGGTRHAELVANFERWHGTIVAGNRSLLTRRRITFDESFLPVWVWPYSGNGPARILNWLSYAVTSVVAGLRFGPVELVYASSPHLFAGLSGWLLAHIRRVPLVLEIRDLWPDVLADMGTLPETSVAFRALRHLELFLYQRAERVIVLTQGVADALVERGVKPAKLVVIPNGADPADFVPPIGRKELRDQFGFEGFVVVYAGAHGPANGLGLVLDAARELAETDHKVTFVLVGDGVDKAGLMERVRREDLANVRFMDPLPKSDMPGLLHAADAGLHVLADVPLFRYGVSPNKLYDYMAAGIPAITNTPGDVGAMVNEADAGVAVSPAGLASGVRVVARASPEQRRTWGSNGREWMAANRSRRALGRQLEALFDEVVAQ